jgi:hypothetical protein
MHAGNADVIKIRPDPECKIKRQLSEEYAGAIKAYSGAALACAYCKSWDTPEHQALRRTAEEAKVKVDRARLDYESHVEGHGC